MNSGKLQFLHDVIAGLEDSMELADGVTIGGLRHSSDPKMIDDMYETLVDLCAAHLTRIAHKHTHSKQAAEVHADFPDSSFLKEGKWECIESPTFLCWYDSAEDPAHDWCLYCGEPEERK